MVALWVLLGFLTWHDLASGVRLAFPKTDNIFSQHLLFDGPVQIAPIIAAILLHACAAIVGYSAVIYPIWGQRRLAAGIWLFLAGIVPGTLIFMTLSRLFSLVLTHAFAPAAILVAVAGATIVSVQRTRQQWRQERLTLNWKTVWPAIGLVGAIFVFTIEMDVFHILGEASTWFTNEVYFAPANGIGTFARFPLVSEHYDEAALLYPIVYGLVRRGAATNRHIGCPLLDHGVSGPRQHGQPDLSRPQVLSRRSLERLRMRGLCLRSIAFPEPRLLPSSVRLRQPARLRVAYRTPPHLGASVPSGIRPGRMAPQGKPDHFRCLCGPGLRPVRDAHS